MPLLFLSAITTLLENSGLKFTFFDQFLAV